MKDCKDCFHCDGALCLREAKRDGAVLVGAQKVEVARAYSFLSLKRCGKSGKYWTPKEG